jgi:hypothetical protein
MNDGTGLHRYWIGFDTSSEIPVGFRLGCGITAHSEAQALHLLHGIYPEKPGIFVVAELVQDVALSDLEPNHVLPNIGDTRRLGVWYPNFGATAPEPETLSLLRNALGRLADRHN